MTIPEEIEKLVRESGNNFHAKVARWLVGDGWHIRVSPYYMDQTQSKAREIDLVAEKVVQVTEPMFGRPYQDLVARLFVECKFIPGHSAFWFSDKDADAAMRLVSKQGGGFKPSNNLTRRHHYLSKEHRRVAKLFATAKSSPEQDPFYKALNQVLNAQVAMQGQPATVGESRARSPAVLNYPVIVCSSFTGIYGSDFMGDSEPTPVGNNFQLEVQYAYTDRSGNARDDYFLIDVVDFAQLSSLSDALNVDVDVARQMLEPN